MSSNETGSAVSAEPPAEPPTEVGTEPEEPAKLYWLSTYKTSSGDLVSVMWNAEDAIRGMTGG